MKTKMFYVAMALVMALALVAVAVPQAGTVEANGPYTYYVNDTIGNDSYTNEEAQDPETPWKTITHAVGNASSGDTIIVADGTYSEGIVTIDKSLTLEGANAGVCAGVDPGTRGDEAIVEDTVFKIDANNVTIDGFKIDGGAQCLGEYAGIYITGGNSGHTIRNNIFVGPGEYPPYYRGILMCCYSGTGTSDIDVTCNDFGDWVTGTYLNPTVANVELSYNTFHDNVAGIGCDASGIIVRDNEFTNNDEGLGIAGNNLVVEDNTFDSNGTGMTIWAGTGTSIVGNDIVNNVSDTGILVKDGAAAGNEAHFNNIEGNDIGVKNEDSDDDFDARWNWWGHPTGPYHENGNYGQGDNVSDNVDYCPWLDAEYATGNPTGPVLNNDSGETYCTIQAAIDDALEGDTILVSPGIYPENIDIGKSLTIQSTGGWENTTISGQDGDVVDVEGFAGTLLLEGFEITGGGNGIDIVDLDFTADVTISNCLIWANSGNGIHVGWVAPESNLTIEDNIITQNGGDGINFGTGMSIVEGTVTIQRNVIGAWYGDGPEGWGPYPGNGNNGIYVWQLGMTGTMTIDQNVIAENGLLGSDGIHVRKVGAHPDAEHPGRGLHITNNAIGGWQFWYDEEHHSTVGGNAYDGIEVEQILEATFVNIEHNAISENGDDGIELGPDGVQGTVRIVENIIGAWTWYPADFEMPGGNATYEGNWGHGIEISGISPSGDVLIQGNLIAENTMVDSGIHVEGTVRGVLDILDNWIGAYTDDHERSYGGNAGSGVYINEVNDPAVVTIADNTISENTGDGIDIDRIYDKHTTVSIQDNTITKNEDGIDIHQANRYALVAIVQNTISYQEHGIRLGSSADGIDIVCNIITENEHGIWVKGDWNNITRNEITNNVGASGVTGIHLTSSAENNQIHNNNITGNSAQISAGVYSYGVYKEGGTPVDATNNYWGAADGPSGSGPGSGDSVNDLVTYDPFLTEPAETCFEGELGAPVIDKAAASPSMISLWWDDWNTYSVGPSLDYAVFYVVAHDDDSGVASVTMNWKDLLVDGLIPAEKLQKFLDQLEELPPTQLDPAQDEWQRFMDEIEALPMKYDYEYGCWYYDQAPIYWMLERTFDFFGGWLNWDEDEYYVVLGEIIGQELNLGEFDVEVTVTDFKGNSAVGYITITIVDYQLPICEGWNLRSTWIALENNKWQDIVAMGDGLAADSILRWNSDDQRWEQFGLGDGGYGWYYGTTYVAAALMEPLEAYWIRGLVNDQIGLITYRGVSAPPSRQMYAGWSLIGAALNWEQPSLRVNDALLSVYEGAGLSTGYTQVLSIDQYNYWYEDLWVCDSWLYEPEYYEKWFEQETWVFTRDFTEEGPRMTRGGGYWVFMANPAVLAGFSSTPLPVDFWYRWWD